MRVAFVGKGGAGKSVVAGTTARLLGREERVLAVDSDPLPGLAASLGVAATDAGIPDDAVEKVEGAEGTEYRLRLSPAEAAERYALAGPDGVRFLQYGKLRGPATELIYSQHAFRQIVSGLPAGWHIVGDLPGGTRQPFFGWSDYADTVVVVTEPTPAGVLSARRLAKLAQMTTGPSVVALANKVRSPDDADGVAARTGLDVVGAIPWDEEVATAERRGGSLIEHSPTAPAVAAIALLVDRLSELSEEDAHQ